MNQKAKRELWTRLRFRDSNCFFSPAYKAKKWDGYIPFFQIENGKFLTGLLPEVCAVLKHFDIPYLIEDLREKTNFIYPSIDENFLNQWLPAGMDPIYLHDYQVDTINQVIKHRRGIIFSPTGSGKTFMMLGILKGIPENTPTLVLQNRVSLAQQNYDEITNWGLKNVGTLWGKNIKPDIITVASVQSISKMEKELSKIKALIVDEVHDMMSDLPKKVYKLLRNCDVRVGVSATPDKNAGENKVHKFYIRGFFGPILKIKSAQGGILTTAALQDRGILSESDCIFYPIREPSIPYEIYIDAVTRGIAENYYFHKVVTRLAKQQQGRTLILVERIAHGDSLHNLLPGSLWVQGKDDLETRKDVIRQLSTRQDNCIAIATQQIFNTGVNFKCHAIINAAGGKADHMIIQRMGRGLRLANDKTILKYYDFIFEINDYLLKHSKKRVKILTKEGHQITIKEIDF